MMKVVVVGLANQQTALPIGEFPVSYQAQRYIPDRIRHSVGGVGFTVARTLSTLGHMVALAAPLGEDYPAAMIDAEAYRYNISTHLCRRELVRTPRSVVLFDESGHRQTYVDFTDAADFRLLPEDLAPDLYRSRLVVLSNLDLTRNLIPALVERDRRFAVDLQEVTGTELGADEPFLQARYINMSNERVMGHEREVLLALRERSHAHVLSMTLGADGALILGNKMDEPVQVPSPSVPARSMVGAGDIYFAAFLHRLVKEKMEPLEAAAYACGAASRYVATESTYGTSNPSQLRAIMGLDVAAQAGGGVPEFSWNSYTADA